MSTDILKLKEKANGLSALSTQFSDGTDTLTHATAALKVSENDTQLILSLQKKKKRKRSKKSTTKSRTSGVAKDTNVPPSPNVLCISRNKHWKYISSYHGPWLQLPVELLESLLVLNLDPTTVSSEYPSPAYLPPSQRQPSGFNRLRERSSSSVILSSTTSYQCSPVASPQSTSPPSLMLSPGKAALPPIDPGMFRSVVLIRRLVDEAAELSVRASSGLSAAALGSLQAGGGVNGNSWTAAQALGMSPSGDFGGNGGGRNVPMSALRVHRLRALAVQKLAEAYKADEIASSVMVMQRGTVFDDIAERVLKADSKNVDARYVHFFHEKIPSRQLVESTSTAVLDQLIAENPQRLEFYRTRGIVHCFRDEYALAAKDFTTALKESRALRRARHTHSQEQRSKFDNPPKAKRKKSRVNGQAPPDGTAAAVEGPDGDQLLIHPSVLPDAPEPVEVQALFLRGASYFAHALFLIEEAFFKLEEISRIPPNDFGEMRLSYVQGKYGGTEVNNPDGPLGRSDGVKARAYRAVFGDGPLREQICGLLKKSKRDHEKFLIHFDSMGPTAESICFVDQPTDVLQKTERAFALLETFRPISRQKEPSSTDPSTFEDVPLMFTTYHPLMLESHFSILNCLLMLGEFETLTSSFERTATIVAGLEGYPVFLPPRSMAHAEFIEALERLASGWKYGKFSNALVHVPKAPSTPRHAEHSSVSRPLITSNDDVSMASSSSAGPSTSCSTRTSPASGRRPSLSDEADLDGDFSGSIHTSQIDPQAALRSSLEHLRFLLAPVHMRLRARVERAAANEKAGADGAKPAPPPLSLALASARVEVILVWLAAVHLPELEAVATSS